MAGLSVVHGLEVASIDRDFQALHRPDLIAAEPACDPDGRVRDVASTAI